MSHEDGQQGRTLVVLLTLLLNFAPGGITRTVIIGQGRKIIADLGERPTPQLAPRARIGEKREVFLPSHYSHCQVNLAARMLDQERRAEWCLPIQRLPSGDNKR